MPAKAKSNKQPRKVPRAKRPSMSAAQFEAWLERLNLSDQEAGEVMGADRTRVHRWRTADRTMPNYMARIAHLVEENEKLHKRLAELDPDHVVPPLVPVRD